MKNITLQNLIDQIASSGGKINWTETLIASRSEAQQSTKRLRATQWCDSQKEAKRITAQKLQERGYFTIDGPSNVVGVLHREHENYLAAVVTVSSAGASKDTISFVASGDASEVVELTDWFKGTFDRAGSLLSVAADVDDRGNLDLDLTFIPEGSANVAHQSFYPWLSIPLEEYYQAFMDSPESILVLFGDAGTGKTTFFRSLMAHGNYDAYLAYNERVIKSPELLRHFHNNSSARILGYEDIDKHLGRRTDGNTLMSSLLNAADGVVQHVGKKLVFITNLPSINSIDSALLRVGRCFDILEFEHLTAEEATAARASKNLPPKEFKVIPGEKTGWTLAEALAPDNYAVQTINRFGRKIGFGS
jgi:hypothetical protein